MIATDGVHPLPIKIAAGLGKYAAKGKTVNKRFNQNQPTESTKKPSPPQTSAPEQVSVELVAIMYSVSVATARRRLAALVKQGRVTVLATGGGRGHAKTYNAREVRRHFRTRRSAAIASIEDVEAMPEPLSFTEWTSQWLRYHEWRESRASSAAPVPGETASVLTVSEASHGH